MPTSERWIHSNGPSGVAPRSSPVRPRPSTSTQKLVLARGEVAERCICCSTALRVPTITLFRCAVCSTVNELTPFKPSTEGLHPIATSEIFAWEAGVGHHRFWPHVLPPAQTLSHRIATVFSSLYAIEGSYAAGQEELDDHLRRFYALVETDEEACRALVEALQALLKRPGPLVRSRTDRPPWRFAIILLAAPILQHRSPYLEADQRRDLLGRLLGFIAQLSEVQHGTIVDALASDAQECLPSFVAAVGAQLSDRLQTVREEKTQYHVDWRVISAVKVQALCYVANQRREADVALPADAFYNLAIDAMGAQAVVADFEAWKRNPDLAMPIFAFCQYPFLLSMGCKLAILSYENRRAMANRARSALSSTLAGAVGSPLLVLRVRRTHIVQDSLQQLLVNRENLKKPLRISFIGEEGVDAGGLLKEWLLLLTTQLFDARYSMFLHDEESLLAWPNPFSFEAEAEFYLVGIVVGLAVYSASPIEVPLPLGAYKMLVNVKPNLSDLKKLRPALARGLEQLLEFDDDVEATFCRSFVTEYEHFGAIRTVELKPGGANIPVTELNRQGALSTILGDELDWEQQAEYVDLLVAHTFNATSRQFAAFAKGFKQVVGGNALSLFRPAELELLVRGLEPAALDIAQLKMCALIEGFPSGAEDVTPSLFWTHLASLQATRQRKLLAFVCGSGRLPATGALRLRLTRGPDGRLPTSHTCFNQLVLPRYTIMSELEHNLWRAIGDSEGFGIR